MYVFQNLDITFLNAQQYVKMTHIFHSSISQISLDYIFYRNHLLSHDHSKSYKINNIMKL